MGELNSNLQVGSFEQLYILSATGTMVKRLLAKVVTVDRFLSRQGLLLLQHQCQDDGCRRVLAVHSAAGQ